MSCEHLADEALALLERGDTDRAESVLLEALQQARQEARRDVEIRVGCVLGELLVQLGDSAAGGELLQHVADLIDGAVWSSDFTRERRLAERYLEELGPSTDPELLEWGD